MKTWAFVFVTSLLILYFNLFCIAQVEEADQNLIFQPFAGGLVETRGLPPATVEGNFYIENTWQVGDIMLKDGKILKQTPIKYDLEHNTMEIYTKQGVKTLYSDKIKQFSWVNTTGLTQNYINVDIFDSNDDITAGFFEIIVLGKYTLVKKNGVEYIESNYSEIHDAGNRNGRYAHTEKYYYITGNEVNKLPKGKKAFMEIFDTKRSEITTFMKENKFGHKEQYHLRKIFEYYNSLQTS